MKRENVSVEIFFFAEIGFLVSIQSSSAFNKTIVHKLVQGLAMSW